MREIGTAAEQPKTATAELCTILLRQAPVSRRYELSVAGGLDCTGRSKRDGEVAEMADVT
ncbi:hypothetical protein B9L19_08595 [Geobacillus thermocatenulatus]|uniref:Uncharacterized protein n=1 Tax=Geobacillus thermocatenulatus TaxID=33938 RepID=A0A226QEJ9_9BACL|nr:MULTISPECIES: hypothetical protein [Geobacillus]ASS99303.1 hypothetical protein GT3921_09785 [Geobacillus thermocatenulatus]KLR73278.1 hypothetical protein ABH20_12000 [Geobacillus sp. T6]OXB90037.1 hypothetical protein B9L19_08595 [Geobacillus thermocatenulatus]